MTGSPTFSQAAPSCISSCGREANYYAPPQQQNDQEPEHSASNMEIYHFSESGPTSNRAIVPETKADIIRISTIEEVPEQQGPPISALLSSVPDSITPDTEEVTRTLKQFINPLSIRLERGETLRDITSEQYENAYKLRFFKQLFATHAEAEKNRLIASQIPAIIKNKSPAEQHAASVYALFNDFIALDAEKKNAQKNQKTQTVTVIRVQPRQNIHPQEEIVQPQDVVVKESGGCCIIM